MDKHRKPPLPTKVRIRKKIMFWPTWWTHADVRDELRATYTVPSFFSLPRVFQYPWERRRWWYCVALIIINILSFTAEKEFLVKTSAPPWKLLLGRMSLKSFLLIKLRWWKLPTATDHLNYPHYHYQICKQPHILFMYFRLNSLLWTLIKKTRDAQQLIVASIVLAQLLSN